MSHEQAVAGIHVSDHVIHLVHLRHDETHHRRKIVVFAVLRHGSQAGPSLGGSAQPHIVGYEGIHLHHIDSFAGVVRTAQAHQNVVAGLAGGDLIVEIELAGLRPMQGNRCEGSEVVGISVVYGTGHFPARGVVSGQEVNVMETHRRAFDLRRPAAGGYIDRYQQVLGIDLDWRSCVGGQGWNKNHRAP